MILEAETRVILLFKKINFVSATLSNKHETFHMHSPCQLLF